MKTWGIETETLFPHYPPWDFKERIDSTIVPHKASDFFNKRFVAARYDGGCDEKDIFIYCID